MMLSSFKRTDSFYAYPPAVYQLNTSVYVALNQCS